MQLSQTCYLLSTAVILGACVATFDSTVASYILASASDLGYKYLVCLQEQILPAFRKSQTTAF